MSAFGPLLNDLVSPDGLDRENALQYIINEAASPQFVMPCVNSGALNILMAMLRNEDESPYLQTCAVWALCNIAVHDFTHNIMLSDQVINPIIVILHNSYNMDLNIKCLSLITNLSTSEQNRAVLNQKGVSRLLAEMIKSNPDMVVHIARPLRNMLLDIAGQHAFTAQAGGVVTLISILSNTFDEYIVREALSLLITLCVNSDLMRKIVVASGALTPLVYLLRSQRDPDILDLTLKVLITLSLSAENEIKLLNSGAIFPVIDILNVCYNQNNSLLEQATLLLSNITCNSEVQKSLRFCGLVQPLQDLLRSNDKGVQVQAARLITNLCLDEYNRSELLDAGTQQPLETLIAKSRDIESKSVFQAALSNLIIPVSDEVQNAIIDQFGSMSIDDMLSPMMSESPFSSAHSSPSPSPSVPVKPVQTSSAPSIIIGSGNQSFFNSRSEPTRPRSRDPSPSPQSRPAAHREDAEKKREEEKQKEKNYKSERTGNGGIILPTHPRPRPGQAKEVTLNAPAARPSRPESGRHKPLGEGLGPRTMRRQLNMEERLTIRKKAAVTHPQMLRREKIAHELLQTEMNYVESLRVVVDLFVKPVTESVVQSKEDGSALLSSNELRGIFSVIEVIYKINSEFLDGLEKVMPSFNPASTQIGTIALPLTTKLKHYERYVTNYDTTITLYTNAMRERPNFAEFVTANRQKPAMKGLDLLSFLIMPVQRIPRYIMLFEDLLKNTTEEHPDHKDLSQALQSTKETAKYLNEAKRQAENTNRVVKIQESLMNSDMTLVADGRHFVREGTMILHSKKGSEQYHFILLNDLLLHTVQKKQKYKVINSIPLVEVSAVEHPDSAGVKNAFKLSWGKEAFVLLCNSPADKAGWLKDLKR